ncbi:Protein KRI1 [Chionoecetes opilio]|uniref:Protein KRI1 n=1 Tax=Chionoecetes opilio TaxID=41210 RepID=A0A8J4YP63_CHIOP|nr:Protein KRI1 [Chionoecetes opilio]
MPKQKKVLFDDIEHEEEDSELHINKAYATKYQEWRLSEELQKHKDRYGDEDLSSESSSDEDFAEADNPEFDREFLRTMGALHSKTDSKLEGARFFTADYSKKKDMEKEEKGMTVKDYERLLITDHGGEMEEEGQGSLKHLNNYHSKDEKKCAFEDGLSADDDDSEDELLASGLFKKVKKSVKQKAEEEDIQIKTPMECYHAQGKGLEGQQWARLFIARLLPLHRGALSPILIQTQDLFNLQPEEVSSPTPPPPPLPPSQPLVCVFKEEQEEHTLNPEADQETASFMKSRQNNYNLTEHEERELAEWYSEHELLYNKKLRSYRDKEKKERLYRKKAYELNMSVKRLHVWCEGMRTRYARLSDRRSGDGTPALTERETWIQTHFAFLKPHIVRCPSRKAKKYAAASCAATSQAQDMALYDGDEAPDGPPSPRPAPSPAAPPLSKRRRRDLAVDADLIERIRIVQQECNDLNSRFISLLQPCSQHSLMVKQFHTFVATMAEQIHPDIFNVYTKDCLALVTHYVNNPPPPRERESGSHQQPQQYPAAAAASAEYQGRHTPPQPPQPSYNHQDHRDQGHHAHLSPGRVLPQPRTGDVRHTSTSHGSSLLGSHPG